MSDFLDLAATGILMACALRRKWYHSCRLLRKAPWQLGGACSDYARACAQLH
jgi:hypothetical protein